ncbi:MAG: hypothetical protein H7333_00510 [Bdellovibrionales bacterium]|nr:hypothetical protein [Oligoflexia bacterium]
MRLGLLLLLFTLFTPVARAWPPTYGTEFNFGNAALSKAFESRRAEVQKPSEKFEQTYARKMAKLIKERCGDLCTVTEHAGKYFTEYQVQFKNDFGFNISVDPACVEIQTNPATAAKIKEQAALIQKYIFDIAKTSGLETQINGAIHEMNAHLNIGTRSAFKNKPKDFARFLADYSNRPALGSGVLGHNYYNAPPMQVLNEKQQNAFQQLIEKVNNGKLATLEDIAYQMNYNVYTHSPAWASPAEARHYQAAGLKQLLKSEFDYSDMPFELRAIRQPRTAQEYQLLTELMDKRIQYVATLKDEPIYYRKVLAHKETLKFSNDRQALSFQIYLAEIGENWQKYQNLIPDAMAKTLRIGQVTKVLLGDIDWNNAYEVSLFKRDVASQFYLSPWMEERVSGILNKGNIPERELSAVIQHLKAQAEENLEHSAVVKRFLLKLRMPPTLGTYVDSGNEPARAEETRGAHKSATPPSPKQNNCIFKFLRALF